MPLSDVVYLYEEYSIAGQHTALRRKYHRYQFEIFKLEMAAKKKGKEGNQLWRAIIEGLFDLGYEIHYEDRERYFSLLEEKQSWLRMIEGHQSLGFDLELEELERYYLLTGHTIPE